MEENKFKKFHFSLVALLVLVLSFFIQTDDLKSQAFFWGTQLQTGESVKQVTAGTNFTCALFVNGRVKCWGRNQFGQLGYNNTNNIGDDESPISTSYVNIGGFVKQIDAGTNHVCALLSNGNVRCWGEGGGAFGGKLGYGNTANVGDGVGLSIVAAGDVNVGAKVAQISAGDMHTCALLVDGNIRCWGYTGNFGPLGYGNMNSIGDNEAPASAGDVSVGGKVKKVVTGGMNTCVLFVDGNVKCWGEGGFGANGNASNLNFGSALGTIPSTMPNISLTALAKDIVGASTTCALLQDGRVQCWGNGFGALGLGRSPGNHVGDNETPAAVGTLNITNRVASLSETNGNTHYCAIQVTGEIQCWGSNSKGQLGYGNTTNVGFNTAPTSPNAAGNVAATALDGKIIQVANGSQHTCALYSTGKLRCWGDNTYGQLGYADTTQRGHTGGTVPNVLGYVGTGGEVRVRQVSNSYSSACALLSNGDVKCWGVGGAHLGYGHSNNVGGAGVKSPQQQGKVGIQSKVKQIAVSGNHGCVVLQDGKLRCWGYGSNGKLGYSNTTIIGDDEFAGKGGDIALPEEVIQVDVAYDHTCALLRTGSVYCWGEGSNGRLGRGNTNDIGDNELPNSVAAVNVGGTAIQVSLGRDFSCVLLSDGNVRCWGNNTFGITGASNNTTYGDNETANNAPAATLSGKAAQISAGHSHVCALLETGDVQCWGSGAYGKLGYGNSNDIGNDELPSTAGVVSLGEKAIQVSAFSGATCALLESGRVKCWGDGAEGKLGYGNTNDIGDDELPSSVGYVELGANAIALSQFKGWTDTSFSSMCALLETGNVQCWGDNNFGQLGIGNNNDIGDDELPYTAGPVKLFPQPDFAPPPNPSNLTATPISGPYINLAWQSGGGSTCDYRISYQTGATAPADCATGTTISENLIYSNNYTVTGLAQSTQYSFRVCAINCDVPTPEVSSGVTASATTWVNPPPNPITPTAIAISEFRIDLSWATGGGTTTDYRISYAVGVTAPATCSTGNTIGEGSITGTSHSVTGLVPSTTYTFRICAINGNPTPDESSGVTVVGVTMNPLAPAYRSVGPGNTNILAQGSTLGNLTIAGSTATFASALPDNVGVGDVIVYDCSGNNSFGGADCVAFIHGRTSSTVYTVKSYNTLTPTAFAADPDWRIYRAYTSLANAETGTENTAISAIDATLGNFDTWSGGYDLTAVNIQWNIALYGDAADDSVTVAGWTTDATRWFRIFAPSQASEVGISQKHNGVWDATKARLVSSVTRIIWMQIGDYFIDGLQIQNTDVGTGARASFQTFTTGPGGNKYVLNNLFVDAGSTTHSADYGILMGPGATGSSKLVLGNNIVIGHKASIQVQEAGAIPFDAVIYNNTVVESLSSGINVDGENSNLFIYNNLVFSSAVMDIAIWGTFLTQDSKNNSTSDDSADNVGGTGHRINQTFTFVNAAQNDYRLSQTDVGAKDFGINLSADPNYAFSTDIAGAARGNDGFWDIGAHEAPTSIFRSVGPSNTSELACGVTVGSCTGQGNLTIAGSTATFASNAPLNIGVGDAIIYDCNSSGGLGAGDCVAFIHGRTSLTVYTVKNASGAAPTAFAASTQWRVYRAYTSLFNAEAGTENASVVAIDSTLGNFDAWTNGENLPAANEIWNIALYADAAETSGALDIVDWTTSEQNYLRVFAPHLSNEVGYSQRHSGAWSDSAARIVLADNQSVIQALSGSVRIDGLQIMNTNSSGNADRGFTNFTSSGSSIEIYLTNNIIRYGGVNSGTTNDGIYLSTRPGSRSKFYIVNNIIVGFKRFGLHVQEWEAGGHTYSAYIYNNTVSGNGVGGTGISGDCGVNDIIKARNNISLNTTGSDFSFYGSCATVDSAYNSSEDATADDGGGAGNRISQTFTFVNAAANDYRLSDSDVGANDFGVSLSADPVYAFSTDTAGTPRGTDGTWDIGAHEAATPIYRSVGPNNTSELACGVNVAACVGQGNLTISGSTATFAAAVPLKVGVGDVIVYDCNTNGSLGASDCVAFIHGRTSNTVYTVKNASGLVPTAYGPNTQWRIYRSSTSLVNALWGSENSAIVAINLALSQYDNWFAGKDLIAVNQQYNIALYDDGVDTANSPYVSSNWVTSKSNSIRIYTPVSQNEVGYSQRHNGTWDSPGYTLEPGSSVGSASFGFPTSVEFEGVKIRSVINDDYESVIGFGLWSAYRPGDIVIKNNILRSSQTSGNYQYLIYFSNMANFKGTSGASAYVYNNIIYTDSQSRIGILNDIPNFPVYAYNNTINTGNTGIRVNYGSILAKNNIVQNSGASNAYVGTFASGSDYNISDDASTTGGANDRASKTVSFLNITNPDYRLSLTDVEANDMGTNLAADAVLPFSTDIIGAARGTDGFWDIGAQEAATPIYRSVGPGNTNVLACGTTVGACTGTGNLTISGSTATFVNTFAKNIGVGDAIVYDCNSSGGLGASDCIAFIHGRTNAKNFTVRNSSGLAPTAYAAGAQWRIYRAYTGILNFQNSTENSSISSIDATMGNFDLPGRNLLTQNAQVHAAFYADAIDQVNTMIAISPVESRPQTNFYRLFVPYLPTEVGSPQRHFGSWSTSAYTFANSVVPNNAAMFGIYGSTEVDGFQIDSQSNSSNTYALQIASTSNYPAELKVKNNIIRSSNTVNNNTAIYFIANQATPGKALVSNNIIYSTGAVFTTGINNFQSDKLKGYLYNNTIIGAIYGIYSGNNVNLAINNIVQGSANNAYQGTYMAGSDYNLGDDATSPAGGANNRLNNTTVSFVDAAKQDYRLNLNDTQAKGFGTNLSTDTNFPFTNDIGMLTRTAPWDIGASKPVPNLPNVNNLAAYWPLEEAAGNFLDYSGNGLDAVPGGEPTRSVSGAVGNAVKFDGYNDFLNFIKPSMPSLNFGNNSLSLAFWINPTSFVTRVNGIRVFSMHNCSSSAVFIISLTLTEGSQSSVNISNGASVSSSNSIQKNNWNHVVIVQDRDYQLGQVYVNGAASGAAVDLSSWVSALDCSNPTTWAHIATSGWNYDGKVDDFSIWGRALTPNEISTLYQKQRPLPALTISSASINEGSNASLTVRIPNPVSWPVTFDWTTADVSANAGSDYTTNGGTGGTIAAGSTSVTLPNILTNNDGNGDPDETFNVNVTNIVGATGSITTGTVRLREAAPADLTSLIISNPVISNITSNSFDAQITFADDSNTNSSVTFYYCSQTDTGGCDPAGGSSVGMNRGAGVFTVSVSNLSNSFIGDTINYKIVATDADNVYGSPLSGQFTLTDVGIPIYRSVGPSNTTALACGVNTTGCTGQGNVTISGSTATFDSGLPNRVGVGDVIVYDCNSSGGLGAGDCVAFIHGRTSSTVYTVKNATGGTPTVFAANSQWHLYRAYTSLNAALNVTENSAIATLNAILANFDDLNTPTEFLHTRNSKLQVNIALYADAIDTTVATGVWYNDAATFVRIYTPTASNEVGVSQRHPGKWVSATQAYTLETTSGSNLYPDINYLVIDGLQVSVVNSSNSVYGINWPDNFVGNKTISNNIIVGNTTANIAYGLYGQYFYPFGTDVVKIYNNIIYGFNKLNSYYCMYLASRASVYVYNNTCYNNSWGFYRTTSDGTFTAKNNISQRGIFADYYGTYTASSTNNLSQDGTAPGLLKQTSKTVTFIDSTANNYLLNSGDTVAKNMGANLSADANLPLTTDILGLTYGSDGTWDIGASEASNNGIIISNLVNSGISSTDFTTTVTFTYDNNSNAALTLYYCNETDTPTCSPTTSLGTMTRGAGTYSIAVAGLANPNDPGDRLKLKVIAVDPDGDAGSPLNGYVYLGNNNPPMLSTVLNEFLYVNELIANFDVGNDGIDDLDIDGHTLTYTCYYDTTINGSVDHLTASLCTQANINNGTGFAFNTGTGVVSGWTPSTATRYEMKIKACDSGTPIMCNFTNVFTVNVEQIKTFKFLNTGSGQSFGIASDGKSYAWGFDGGALGENADGDNNTEYIPTLMDSTNLTPGSTLINISTFSGANCGLSSDGRVYCWGDDTSGTIGNGAGVTSTSIPVSISYANVTPFNRFLTLFTGSGFACALASDGVNYCWGGDANVRLGNSLSQDEFSPVPIETTNMVAGSKVVDIQGGSMGGCVHADNGKAYCWGYDGEGQVGNGTGNASQQIMVPLDTANLTAGSDFIFFGFGWSAKCGKSSDSKVYCWGPNNGDLGFVLNGDFSNKYLPIYANNLALPGSSEFISIVGSSNTFCGTASNGKTYCWGADFGGRLGDNADLDDALELSPVEVDTSNLAPGTNFIYLEAGSGNICGIANDGRAYCWGSDSYGRLGNDGVDSGFSSVPVRVDSTELVAGDYITSVSSGEEYACGISGRGRTYCWGRDTNGQLGENADGDNAYEYVPVAVDTSMLPKGVSFKQVFAGYHHTCAISSEQKTYCWGYDIYGQLGENTDGDNLDENIPVLIDTSNLNPGASFISLALGKHHTCGLSSDFKVYCWGRDHLGQLGENADGDNLDENIPVLIDTSNLVAGSSFKQIVAGKYHTCGIASNGKSYCWGSDVTGQLGDDGVAGDKNIPTLVDTTALSAGTSFKSLTAFNNHTCGLAGDGKAFCWGSDSFGQLGENADGDNTSEFIPVLVDTSNLSAGTQFKSINAGFIHTCGIASDGKSYCWGYDFDGQLGDDVAFVDKNIPTLVSSTNLAAGTSFISIDAGGAFTCGNTNDGKTYCWGIDSHGELGENADGDNLSEPLPTLITFP